MKARKIVVILDGLLVGGLGLCHRNNHGLPKLVITLVGTILAVCSILPLANAQSSNQRIIVFSSNSTSVQDLQHQMNDIKGMIQIIKQDPSTLIIASIGAISGIGSVVVTSILFMVGQKGYMKLKLESNFIRETKNIVSKTSIENTSKVPYEIRYCALIICKGSDDSENIMNKLEQKTRNRMGRNEGDTGNPIVDTLFEIYKPRPSEEKLKKEVQDNECILHPLIYYHKLNQRLGSFEILSTTYQHMNLSEGKYSIVFLVFGSRQYLPFLLTFFLRRRYKYKKFLKPSPYRFVCDEVVVPTKRAGPTAEASSSK